jgi:arylsulfatase A-like enzyme
VPAAWRTRFSAHPGRIDLYDASIAMQDAVVGTILDALRARGLLDNTLLVISSDHGEHLGRRGLTSHGNSLYLPVLRIPLMVRLPRRVPAGRRIQRPVSLAGLPATVMSVLDARTHDFPGESWLAADTAQSGAIVLSEVEKAEDEGTPAGRAPLYSLVTPEYHYIYSLLGAEELYDVRRDTNETNNLARVPEHQRARAMLRAELLRRVPELAALMGPG